MSVFLCCVLECISYIIIIEITLNFLGVLFNTFSGAVPIIMPLLFSPELEIQDQALFAIGNIISKKAKYIQ